MSEPAFSELDQRDLRRLAEGVHAVAVLVDELLERVARLETKQLHLAAEVAAQGALYAELERRIQRAGTPLPSAEQVCAWQANAQLVEER